MYLWNTFENSSPCSYLETEQNECNYFANGNYFANAHKGARAHTRRVLQSRKSGMVLICVKVGQWPSALAEGVGGGCLGIFSLVYFFSLLSHSL